ncbi:MAG: VWA domain-containing protein [Planctomycetes bacterium]|nr:VWA domain-containing protein [Planctomycetota bacterium]
MIGNILFKPVISMPVLLGLGVLGIVAILGGTLASMRSTGPWRCVLLGAFRAVVLGGFLLILARPMILKPEPVSAARPCFSVLVDSSLSMNTKDVGDQSRFDAAKGALFKTHSQSLLNTLSDRFNLQLYRFDDSLHPQTVKDFSRYTTPDGQDTRMGEALMNLIETGGRHRPKGVLMLSDGRTNGHAGRVSVTQAAQALRMMKIPVWTVPLGEATQVKDVYIVGNLNAGYLLAEQPGSIRVSVFGNGYNNQAITLKCYREDQFVSSTQVILKNGYAEAVFPVQEPHRGVYQYRIEADAFADEADTENNERFVVARVIDEKVRVLVVEATVHWDSKFLLRALHSDMNVEVTSIFHINRRKTLAVVETISEENGLTKTVTPGVTMPKTLDELRRYDCLFLGKDMVDVFDGSQLRMIQDYVSIMGGSVVFFRGKSYGVRCPELEALEPVRWGKGTLNDVQFELTDEGKTNPIFEYGAQKGEAIIRELPGMTSVTRVAGPKSLAVILAQTEDQEYGGQMATVAYQRYGKGKVMSIGASGLWRWGFLPERLKGYDDVYARFWGQMVRWLVSDSEFLPGQNISFIADRHTYGPDELVRLAVTAKMVDHEAYKPKIELTLPDGQTEFLYPGRDSENETFYAAHFNPQMVGAYKAILHNDVGTPQQDMVRFTVYDDSVEARRVEADQDLMERLASTTGADVLSLSSIDRLPDKIRAFEQLSKERVKPKDIWDRGMVFACLVILLGLEWLIRRMWGLV